MHQIGVSEVPAKITWSSLRTTAWRGTGRCSIAGLPGPDPTATATALGGPLRRMGADNRGPNGLLSRDQVEGWKGWLASRK